jgi:NAD(P)-dependent dehydrogenase (short-subunit alcohol dehydrogenase family)
VTRAIDTKVTGFSVVYGVSDNDRAPVLELTDENWHDGMEVYFLNAVPPTRRVMPIMQKQGGGAIIHISTFAVFEPNPVAVL